MHDEDYKSVVLQTIQSLPQNVSEKLKDIVIAIEDRPPVQIRIQEEYSKTPQPIHFYSMVLPEKITIYKKPLLRLSSTLEEARGHIKDAVIKEVSNYFGISEFELRRIRPTN